MSNNKLCIVALKLAIGNSLLYSSLIPFFKKDFSTISILDKSYDHSHSEELKVNAGINALSMFLSLFNIKLIISIFKFIKHHNPEVIYFLSSHPLNFIIASYSKFFVGSKVVSHIHDPIPHGGSGYGFFILISQWFQTLVSNLVFVSGSQLVVDVSRYYPIAEKNIRLVKFGAHRLFENGYSRQNHAKRFRFSVLGRIEFYKGIDYFIEASKLLIDKYPDADLRFTIAGKGDFKKYNALINKYSIEKYFDILNYTISDEVFDSLVSESHAVVLPYRDATQTGTTQICFALSTPVIVSDAGALPEDVKLANAGLIVPIGDINKLSNAMERLFIDKTLFDFFSKNAKNYFDKELNWSFLSAAYINSFRSLM